MNLIRYQKILKFYERFCFLEHLSTFSLSFPGRLFLTENMVSMCFCSVLIIMYTFVFLSKTICALARLHLQHRTKTQGFWKNSYLHFNVLSLGHCAYCIISICMRVSCFLSRLVCSSDWSSHHTHSLFRSLSDAVHQTYVFDRIRLVLPIIPSVSRISVIDGLDCL